MSQGAGVGSLTAALVKLVAREAPAVVLDIVALELAGVQCPNLCAAFLALGYMNLVEGGQVVAIIPRSFANGW